MKSCSSVVLPKIVTRIKCSKVFDSERAMHALRIGFFSLKQKIERGALETNMIKNLKC